MSTPKIGIILGTRPEIIKLSKIIKILEENKDDYFIIHTNQHYSENMDLIFFEELGLPAPKYNLNIGSGNHGGQIGKMLIEIEKVLLKEKPYVVFVQGDTNTVLAGGLVANKLQIKVGHVEAGLRSYDRTMPEENNRVMVDHISDFLFCPTEKQKNILINEGIEKDKVYVVGNTIVDALHSISSDQSKVLDKYDLKSNEYFLLTMHRAENVDTKPRLEMLVGQINNLSKESDYPIIFPIHPRTQNKVKEFGIKFSKTVMLVEPISFVDNVTLQKNAICILTDSGGIQEEACVLGIPSVTLRDSTERPETIEVGANILFSGNLVNDFNKMAAKERNWKNPFGDGKTSERIISIVSENEKN